MTSELMSLRKQWVSKLQPSLALGEEAKESDIAILTRATDGEIMLLLSEIEGKIITDTSESTMTLTWVISPDPHTGQLEAAGLEFGVAYRLRLLDGSVASASLKAMSEKEKRDDNGIFYTGTATFQAHVSHESFGEALVRELEKNPLPEDTTIEMNGVDLTAAARAARKLLKKEPAEVG